MSCADCPTGERSGNLARLVLDLEVPARVCSVGAGMSIEPDRWYVVVTPDGERVGRSSGYRVPVLPRCSERSSGVVVRSASAAEIERAEQLRCTEREALTYCRQRALELGLPMRPVAAIAPLDRDVMLVFFAAEERVDFRELLRELGRRVRRRVELRQIGVRDQAKTAGGWGPCGRPMCCATFMARFSSVTIRMAKAQNLSLSPSRISGMCGRLMCCLAHEASPPAPAHPPNG